MRLVTADYDKELFMRSVHIERARLCKPSAELAMNMNVTIIESRYIYMRALL